MTRRRVPAGVAVALALALAPAALAPSAAAAPASGESTSAERVPYPAATLEATAPAGLDDATRQAADLQREVTGLLAESVAIEGRIRTTTQLIYRQAEAVERARAEEASAQARFDERVIGMYKAGGVSTLEIILTARSFGDALDRGIFLMSVLQRDEAALLESARISAEAEHQAQLLDRLRAQDVVLRQAQESRVRSKQDALARQRLLVARLDAQQKRYLAARAAAAAAATTSWKDSSFYGATVRRVAAALVDEPGTTYLVDEGEPVLYRALDAPRMQVCSWYGNADNAPTPTATASGRAFNENEFTCASRTLPFGTRLALTYRGVRIVVVVTDRGPYVAGRDLDLSKSAAHTLGFDGVEQVSVRTVAAVR